MNWLECKKCGNRDISIGVNGKTCLKCDSHNIGWSK